MENLELGRELFQEGERRLSNFYERAPYSGSGIHSTDFKAMIVRDYFVPAAECGFPLAMKECGDYYANSNKSLALSYYKRYLKVCPYDKAMKAFLVARFGIRMLM